MRAFPHSAHIGVVFTAAAVSLGFAARRPAHGSSTPRCAAELETIEREWGSTEQWRRLAPHPEPREASPTDSVGVWLERWHLDGNRTDLRRVSASETRIAQFDSVDCAPVIVRRERHYDASALAAGFTDRTLRQLLADSGSGMIYVWSPRMPLSIAGIREAESAARSLGVRFTAVVADATPSEAAAA